MTNYKTLSGKKVIITACLHHHGFNIGQEVTLVHDDDCADDEIAGFDEKGDRWWLTEEEFEIVEPDNLRELAYNVAINWNHAELGCPSPLPRQMTTGLQETLDQLVEYFKTHKIS